MVSPVGKSALQQLQSMAAEASGGVRESRQLSTRVGEGGFAEELRSSIVKINQLQQQATATFAGEAGVNLHEVMLDKQKASIAFQAGVQVRNRLVTAYKEIMNMQI